MKNTKIILTAVILSGSIGLVSGSLRGQNRRLENAVSEKQFEARMSKDDMRMVQQSLKAQGFDPGSINGEYNSQTKAALRDYQKQHNLDASGAVDGRTLDSLGVVVIFIPAE